MDEVDLQVLFCLKINREYRQYKDAMLKREPEEVWNSAYEIDNRINLYELLLEISRKLGEEELIQMIAFPGLLTYLYGRWLKQPDSYAEEMDGFLKACMQEITKIPDNELKHREENDAA